MNKQNAVNLTTDLPKLYDNDQLWCLTLACPCHKVLKQKLTASLLIPSFTKGSSNSGSRPQHMGLALKDKRQRKPSRGKQCHKLTLLDCELEGLFLPPVSQVSKVHILLSLGLAWANPPENEGQVSGVSGPGCSCHSTAHLQNGPALPDMNASSTSYTRLWAFELSASFHQQRDTASWEQRIQNKHAPAALVRPCFWAS